MGGILALLITPLVLLFSDFSVVQVPAVLLTLSWMILALEPLVSGIKGRWI
jgi:hypothetical protein